jgi:hypothetical protein
VLEIGGVVGASDTAELWGNRRSRRWPRRFRCARRAKRNADQESGHRRGALQPITRSGCGRPAAAVEAPTPAQQRLRADAERAPRHVRQHAADCGEEEPVALLEPCPVHLPPQDRQRVAQHEELGLLRTFAARQQHYQRE